MQRNTGEAVLALSWPLGALTGYMQGKVLLEEALATTKCTVHPLVRTLP